MSSTTMVGTRDSEGLRRVEKDVLISKKVKEKAMKLCGNYVQGTTRPTPSLELKMSRCTDFEDCIRGRTVSAAWKCRDQNSAMQKCLIG